MRKLLPLLLLLTFSMILAPGCVKKDRKCVKEHKKARKKGVGWQY